MVVQCLFSVAKVLQYTLKSNFGFKNSKNKNIFLETLQSVVLLRTEGCSVHYCSERRKQT